MTEDHDERSTAFGQEGSASSIDRLGVWLSSRGIRRHVGSFAGKRVGDFGCGFDAAFSCTIADEVASLVLVDVSLAPGLGEHPRVQALEGPLPETLDALEDASLDVVLCISVLEHLWEPERMLASFRRLLRPGGVCVVNVPSWLGKRALEFSAFKLGLSPAYEMDDHKNYYDPRDLWPFLVRGGFKPSNISCHRHKLGLNTIAVCRIPEDP
jgi:2-polyprenyl-6-hydroxyphenyl methylase/3-demethylubiquinone-9 3-methyltransferase